MPLMQYLTRHLLNQKLHLRLFLRHRLLMSQLSHSTLSLSSSQRILNLLLLMQAQEPALEQALVQALALVQAPVLEQELVLKLVL